MSGTLLHILDRFAEHRIVVIGEAMLDSYLEGSTDRLCREAPVPVVTVSQRRDAPGGAANTAVNARALGCNPRFLTVLGDDPEGYLLRNTLRARGLATDWLVTERGRATLAKHRVLAASHMLVRFDQGSTGPINRRSEQRLINHLIDLFQHSDGVILSDYGYGIFTPRVIQTIAELQAQMPRVLVVDSKSLERYRGVGVTAVKPNYSEAIRLLALPRLEEGNARAEQILAHGDRVLELTGAQIAAVTLDTDGALLFERGRPPYRTYARPRPNCCAAGAGDTFVSALTLALTAGADLPSAAELAAAAAEIVVAKEGTASCSAPELRGYFGAQDKRVSDLAQLEACVAFHRERGKRIVFTNGCFDILHRGHVTYLSRAKALGDILIVGLNSDDSVRRLKGPRRPINTLEDRVQVLAALSCVDHVIPFNEDTPIEIIRVLRPDLFVKGGDYTRETLPEAPVVEELGGEIQILPYLEDRSTTGVIERIREAYPWPVNGRELNHERK